MNKTNFALENGYQEGSIMYDYCETIKEDPTLRAMREVYQTVNETLATDNDIDHDAERALEDAMHGVGRAIHIQSEATLRDLAEERSVDAGAEGHSQAENINQSDTGTNGRVQDAGIVELEPETVDRLIYGASNLYRPAFPDEEERKNIIAAIDCAEEALQSLQTDGRQEVRDEQ